MAPKRGQDSLSPISPVPPRSTSPSSGITQFLSKPARWFTRSASASKATHPQLPEPRPSFSNGARKHKISQPTDPRPILDGYSGHNARSVLDLSVKSPLSREDRPSLPSSPVTRNTGQLGDLRDISRKAWSKSADDLSKITTENLTPTSQSFQDRIAEYRNRNDDSSGSCSPISPPIAVRNSPTSGPALKHPFPSYGRSSPSPSRTSPVRSDSVPIPTSISSPAIEESSVKSPSSGQSHVHTRSHSFTPKLPSKLSTPRFPQGPQRGVGHDRDIDTRHVSQLLSPNQAVATPTKQTFGFPFISHKSSLPPESIPGPSQTAVVNRHTTFLPPPIIIEPEQQLHDEPETLDPRRTSQILFYSGFVNRFGDFHHHLHPNLQFSKGWKPFKLELKGSKLYFYKPPYDKTAAIKDLFPTSLLPPSLDEEQEHGLETNSAVSEKDGSRPWMSKEGVPGRKKRAFWGRRTHPDIVKVQSGNVQKGSFEALIHEAVFGTTFLSRPVVEETEPKSDEEREDAADDQRARILSWRMFASSILLVVPFLVPGGRLVFESEFLRCCSYLVSGSKDEDREEHTTRVAWLLNEYLRFHVRPADPSGWEELKKEAIPGISLSAETFLTTPNLPSSSSINGVFQPSPLLDSRSLENSPNLNLFSPRPEEGKKMVPLLEALFPAPSIQNLPFIPHPYHAHVQQPMRPGFPPGPAGNRFPWTKLFEEGMTRDLFLSLDPHLVAGSLSLYHRSVLEQCPMNIFADFLIAGSKPDGDDTRPPEAEESTTKDLSDFLFGNEERPHWLTRLLLLQILGAETSAHHPDDHHPSSSQQQTSRTHSRSDVISVWVKIGEMCRVSGDECSWKAISAALCSRPIARLSKVWKRVDPQALAAVQRWIFGKSSLDGAKGDAKVGQPQMTPWGGNIKDKLNAELIRANEELMIKCAPLLTAVNLFEGFRISFELCPRKTTVVEGDISDDTRKLISFWKEMADEGGGRGGMAVKFQKVDQFMSLSLAAEPRRKGLFEPYFWTKPSSSALYTPLIPLLFPDALPTLTLIDRSKLIRGRIDSDASEGQYLRSLEVQLRQESGRQLQGLDNPNKDFTKKLILGHGGTVIPVYEGNLLLVTQSGGFESAPNSRPSSKIPSRPESSVLDFNSSTERPTISRNTSIRVKPNSSYGLERKTSMARRSSLPAVTHLSRSNFVTTEPSTDPPLRVLVQAGTLNNLVNILVHGLENISVSVADDNGEMTLREGKTRELALDKVEFARVWWNVFRSFLTPYVFFELLRKNYLSHPMEPSDVCNSAIKRVQVLNTLHDWLTIGSGAQDILDDVQLFSAIQTFLDDTLEPPARLDFAPAQTAFEMLSETRKTVRNVLLSQSQRPTAPPGLQSQRIQAGARNARRRNTIGRDVPDLDRMDPEAFVDNLEGMASAAFSNVTEEDLYITADLLEVQSADRTGWFLQREGNVNEDTVEIQTIYSHILEVEPSSLISELSHDSLYRLLPPGVRSCIRAYSLIRRWLISKLVAPRIGLRARQARIELLIQAIELARLKNTETPATAQSIEQPCVRSFVEAVTTAALLSPEIRLHHRTWQSVALGRNCSCDSLSSLLLHRPFVQSTSSQESLTADMGWLLERMIEIIATRDVIEGSPSINDGQQLINFDKRRHLCNLISKVSCIPSQRKPPMEDSIRRGFERLNIVEKEVASIQFDFRGIKEDAFREASSSSMNTPSSSKKSIRPFQKIIVIQMEKNRRDKHMRSRFLREKVQEQTRIERRDDVLNKAMRMRKPTINSHKRNKKSMSAFLSFMRPISSAFGADVPPMMPKRSPAELDFPATGKPSLVINVLDAKIAHFINNERSYLFQLSTEDGHYLLQAMNKREMNKWLETISRVTNTAAKRRLTYIGSSPKPQIADHIHSHPIVASRDPLAVFGVELEFLLRRETGNEIILPGTVPLVIEQCLSEIETRGLTEVGIYRIAGAATLISSLKQVYNLGEVPDLTSIDIHVVCDLVKTWFRILPEPLFPPSSYRDAMEVMRLENVEDRLLGIRNVIQELPRANLDLLRRVSEHLDKVTDFEECNHMTAEALAIVFSPNLLRAPQNDFAMILNNMGLSHKLVKVLITHFHFIFDEAEPDAEHGSEDELDGPILEEDEEEEEGDAEEEEEDTHDLMQNPDNDKQHPMDSGNNDST